MRAHLLLPLCLIAICRAQGTDRSHERLAELASDDWAVREAATRELERLVREDTTGGAEREVERGVSSVDAEVVARCRWILADVEDERLEMVVAEVAGDAEVQASPKEKWETVKVGMKVPRGACLCTGVGSGVLLAIGKFARVTVCECSILNLEEIKVEPGTLRGTLFVDPGRVDVKPSPDAGLDVDLRIKTPRLTASVRGSSESVER